MAPHFVYVSVLLMFVIPVAECISCYTCTDVTDESVCIGNMTTCGTGQSCYKATRVFHDTELFTLGCMDNLQCSSVSGAGSIVGRNLHTRQTLTCKECCSTDLCNAQMCHHQSPSACVDDESVDCARLHSLFDICNDVQHAKTICPKFCKLCNVVDGNWSKWSGWSNCDVSCNNGTETRTRYCTNPQPEHGGLDCVGNSSEMRSCYTATVCPVNGGWGTWTNWGQCSVSCETGIKRRERTCTNPKPAYYGDHCFGPNVEAKLCTEMPCADGGWSSWSSWSTCSRTCDVGIRSQLRSCNNPKPSLHGQECSGNSMRVDTCVTNKCVAGYSDCSAIKSHDIHAQDGVYEVSLTNRTLKVYCDMTTDGGGWTVFQNRYDGSVDFYRNYSDYVHGFGNLNTEFWLGLDYIQEMTSSTVNELRIDMTSSNGTTAFETFSSFSLSSPNYVLHVGNTTASNNIGSQNRFGPFHNGHAFTTYDHGVDNGNCATVKHGAWWYNNCFNANLNGLYLTPGSNDDKGIMYLSFIYAQSLKQTRMAFRRK